MATYPILPSLTRAPSFDTSRKLVDGTIRSPRESGYETSRPRFTRQRRTFGVTYKNICAEDVRVLDAFEVGILEGGASAFYMPNLLNNGSFELSGTNGEMFSDWNIIAGGENEAAAFVGAGVTLTYGSNVEDGSRSLGFRSVNGTSVSPTTPSGAGASANQFVGSVTPGDVMLFSGKVNVAINGMQYGVTVTTQPFFSFAGASQIYAPSRSATTFAPPGVGYQDYEYVFTIPQGAQNITASLLVWFTSATGSVVVLDGTSSVYWDHCALACISAYQPYGKMPGTSSPSRPVRLTKPLDIRDAKWSGGEPRFDVTMEVVEI